MPHSSAAPRVTPDLAYDAGIMFIRSLTDFNRVPWVVKLVTVGAITVTAQAHDSQKSAISLQRSADF